jgi:hypothetical protein
MISSSFSLHQIAHHAHRTRRGRRHRFDLGFRHAGQPEPAPNLIASPWTTPTTSGRPYAPNRSWEALRLAPSIVEVTAEALSGLNHSVVAAE